MFVAGCDIGSTTGKVVILKDDQFLAWSIARTAHGPEATAQQVMKEALTKAGLDSTSALSYIIGTGYGRSNVSYVQDDISEITCHARGALWLHPAVRTIVDIGGQDCKVISLNKAGKVADFSMNDKCAAGTGRFFEAMCRVLDCSLDDLANYSLQSQSPKTISKQCSVFAESEVITLVNNNVKISDIAAGIHDSIARRIHGMVYKIGIVEDIVLTGGCARNQALIRSLEQQLHSKITELNENPQLAGALGAALFARDRAMCPK
ncbi:2-hydroxyisocaproyl-CoA dehydratase activator [Sporomusa silvacetica DSM 10669]|uniref:2-hydroxyisocaproyl-CoA dehydratase activator n=1 Tax=Sporomusa silvacetica DSM 10669 TaxID=1123289 RepID=A0ABZ3IPU7_9FIRM|nr:acyl-CoA dehydratase activase [Sporomusa silvacetica]OZC19860.1 R-phenyllactate dehydratase activator [Sporomusa silvacetica DSM 10669]